MRIVHARKRVWGKDFALEKKMSLLVWILSIIKWKQYNNKVILYCDKITLEAIKKVGFDYLYDEINTDLLEDEEVCEGINFYYYWAMPKILALRHEVIDLKNDIVIADQDVVPMSDLTRMWTNSDVTVWSNKEFVELKGIYMNLRDLSFPADYKLPEWFCGKAKPLNTGILHIKDKDIVDFYTSEALKMVVNNSNRKNNSRCQAMCGVEQRLLGEIVKHKNLTYSIVQPLNEGLFNRNAFHTHGYKTIVNDSNGLLWHLNLLLMIKEKDNKMFNILINNEIFKEEKEYFDKNGYTCKKVKELTIY